MRLTSWIPLEILEECEMIYPIGLRLCNHSMDYIEKDELLSRHDELIEARVICPYHHVLHFQKFKLKDG